MLRNEHGFFSGFLRVVRHFFPNLSKQFNQMNDPRHSSYIKYSQSVLVWLTVMKCNGGIKTMRGMTRELNTDEAIRNLSILSESDQLDEKPDWQTVNNYLEKLEPNQLEQVQFSMIRKLIRTKDFADYTLDGRYIVVIDGTGYAYFPHKHCEHDLVTKKTDPQTGEVRYEYYHKVVEAKVLLGPGMVVSIGSEFIENEDENVSKQDCEFNAGYRLLKKIKKAFPRLKIVVVADALYAAVPFMKAVRDCGWDYIFRIKEGRQQKLMEDFEDLLNHVDPCETVRNVYENEEGRGIYVNGVDQVTDKEQICNIFRYSTKDRVFNWVTNIGLTKQYLSGIIITARSRWKIENEGFNTQKCGIYDLEHLCSYNYNAMKNHYLLIQLSYTLMQLYMAYDKIVYRLKEGMKHTAFELHVSFREHALNGSDMEYISARTALHLCCLLG
jgi:hypothetical protein